ncbi:ABC transporter [Bradyrhizobium sp. CCBAU 45394]|uniref:ABC transporter n=1 Tax=Bradyrhizobium sp. CCBAU 45394 TaxID=1325087 RepID=UPI00230200A6|nr:ABC transporter [Bradyrhizobium sp. CCBAU 45394]
MFDDKSTAGKGIADVVEAQLKRFGEQVIRQSYVAGEKDYRAFGLKNEEGSGARRLYRRLSYRNWIVCTPGIRSRSGLIVMASDPLMTSEFWAITSRAGNRTLFTFMPAPARNANALGVVARLKASNLSEGYTLYAYAAVQAWAEALLQCCARRQCTSFTADRYRDWPGLVRYKRRQCGSWFSRLPLAPRPC